MAARAKLAPGQTKRPLCATAQGQRRAATGESDAFFLATPPNFRACDPDFARRFELHLLRLRLSAFCNSSHTIPRALTFEVRGGQKAQPLGRPLDRRVRAPVAEGHGRGGRKQRWPGLMTNQDGTEARKASNAFAVRDSLLAHGAGATRRTMRALNTNLLTIQVREAQAID